MGIDNKNINYIGLVLFFIFILSGAKYNILLFASLFFFGLYFYNEKFNFITLAYIIFAPFIMVLVPHFFGETGKYILITLLILLVAALTIIRIKSGKSIW